MSTDKARIAELNVLLDKAERENTRLAKELAREIDAGCVRDAENTRLSSRLAVVEPLLRAIAFEHADERQKYHAETVRLNGGVDHQPIEPCPCKVCVAVRAIDGTTSDATAIRQPAPDVQTALVDALEGLLAHLGPGGYIPHAGKPATDRARAALKLAGRGTP